jgi:hypothetical protein
MVKKGLIIILTLAVLLVFAGPALSRKAPGPHGFGPVVLGHPWGDYSPRSESIDTPVMNRPGSGAGVGDMIMRKATSFAVQFYVKYVSKKRDGLVSIRHRGKSD